ncbi:uncharacterized protein B0J16DRAFT_418367 [Fusarium flagelliforme]|uniref:uncharacterized protein n=1 Tax=Fusarium flagelliforme TaxID=2675880 RepID=UPI001E8D0E85|nr:uncharacterized protein B0J16DRAFT_418367 [Fusarium flagelliforme]KAH7174972.1 hypothetical protein B0J16DRAFT_418367 [Fusarium flagelliforme]
MAAPPPPGAVAPSPYTLFDRINHISADSDDLFNLIEDLEQHVDASAGWRWHAAQTQIKQNNVYKTYKTFLTGLQLVNQDFTEDEEELAMFPVDKADYILFIAKFGRGVRRGTKISYRGLVGHRMPLMFWYKRIHTKRGSTTAATQSQLFNAITEAMRYATSKFGLTLGRVTSFSQVGIPELRQLIDYDTLNAVSIEVTEGHHLAWCIARVCAVRPGSIGISGQRTVNTNDRPFLTWGDIEITRLDKGRFQARITFRNLKTNYPDPEKTFRQKGKYSSLTCVINSPTNIDNLIFSIPHRLLVLALRRQIIDSVTTIDELMRGNQRNITINHEHLPKPVILASKPRGLGTIDEPVTVSALSEYLKRRGSKLGYPEALNFYSIRRRAADDLTRQLGRDAARAIMDHDPDSRVLEKYYLSLGDAVDVSRISLNEDTSHLGFEGYSHQIDQETTLAANVLSNQKAREIHGPAVNALMVKLMSSDPGFPYTASNAELKNYKRRIRKVALDSLLGIEVQKQRERMTKMDFDSRLKHLNDSKLMDVVMEKARAQLTLGDTDHLDEEDDNPAIDDETQQIVHGLEEKAEPDLEEQAIDGSHPSEVHRELDGDGREDEDEGDAGGDGDSRTNPEAIEVDYETAVRTFMHALLDDTLTQHKDFKNNPTVCPLCQEDDTITDPAVKDKVWSAQIKLNDHMKTVFHTPRAKWIRRVEANHHVDAGGNGTNCPYYERVGITRSFLLVGSLVRHIETNTDVNHKAFAQEDGWFTPGWASHPQAKSASSRQVKEEKAAFRKQAAFLNIPYSSEQSIDPCPHESIPGAVRAPGPSPITPIPGVYWQTGDDIRFEPGPSALDAEFAALTVWTSQPPATSPPIPAHLSNHIIMVSPLTGEPVEQVNKKRAREAIEPSATKRPRRDD